MAEAPKRAAVTASAEALAPGAARRVERLAASSTQSVSTRLECFLKTHHPHHRCISPPSFLFKY
jgi:hypothetical protein